MAWYTATLTSEFAGQIMVNNFNYVSAGTPTAVTGSFGLYSALGAGITAPFAGGTLLGLLAASMCNQFRFVSLSVTNLLDPTDFYVAPYPSSRTGGGGSESTSPALALGFTTTRVRRDVRVGQKRFSGFWAGYLSGEGSINPASITGELAILAQRMSDALQYPVSGAAEVTYTPAIIKRERYVAPSGNPAYRLPTTVPELTANTVTGFSWFPRRTVSTQTSRQYGRGD